MHGAAKLSKGSSHHHLSWNKTIARVNDCTKKDALQEDSYLRCLVMLFKSLVHSNKDLAFPWLLVIFPCSILSEI
jgi:hypothetical protein